MLICSALTAEPAKAVVVSSSAFTLAASDNVPSVGETLSRAVFKGVAAEENAIVTAGVVVGTLANVAVAGVVPSIVLTDPALSSTPIF